MEIGKRIHNKQEIRLTLRLGHMKRIDIFLSHTVYVYTLLLMYIHIIICILTV
jgi:hypothetical protein